MLVKYLPSLWGFFYHSLNVRGIYFFIAPLRRLNNRFNCRKFETYLLRENFDVIISTQFLAGEIICALKRKHVLKSILITVITDFRSHSFWEGRQSDVFVVGAEATREDLLRRGIAARKIKVLGIPIEPPLKDFNRTQLRAEMGLDSDRFTVLLTSGAFSIGPLKSLIYRFQRLDAARRKKLQVIAVCAKNEKLYREMQHLRSVLDVKLAVFGLLPGLYKAMAASNVIVAKSGGMTTSESLAQGIPMIITAPIPGQESRNCRVMLEADAALRADAPEQIKRIIVGLIDNPQELDRIRANIAKLGRPNSARDVASLVI
jgi:processive 1,2-diacylglycerol beta-glucosyltransferase